jgi:lipopolysaccharide export system permease protein
VKILHKYVLIEWLYAFLASMLLTAGLLISEDVYKNFHNFIHYGVAATQIFYYYSWLLVRICPIIIPVSFFTSLLFSLGKLHRSNELTSMRAIGLNIFQITLPLWIAGGILSAVGLFFNVYLSSVASQRTQDFHLSMKFYNIHQNLAFNNERDGRTWFLGKLNRLTSSGNHAMVYLRDSNGNESSRIFANTFSYRGGVWIFRNGFNTIFDENTHQPSTITKFDELKYACDESPELFLSLVKLTKHLSSFELRKLLSFSGNSSSFIGYRVRLYWSTISALSCLLTAFIAIPFSTIGVRRNPMIGVAKACAMLFVFYLLSSTCNALGSNGLLPVYLAVCLPYAIVLLPAYSLYKKCI